VNIIPIVFVTLLSLLSTGIMSYISLVTPIGPWIAPTVVLATIALYRFVRGFIPSGPSKVAITVAGASVGGIIATALSFSFPTLFFLNKAEFNQWLVDPFSFICSVSVFSFIAALFGFVIADSLEHKFIDKEQLPFPIGQLIYKMIAAHNQAKRAWELALGFIVTMIFCMAQDGISGIPKSVGFVSPKTFVGGISLPLITFDIFPIYWAIGFVTGHVIAIPLFIGTLAQIFFGNILSGVFFPNLSIEDFLLAFGSGMVLAGAVYGLVESPAIIWNSILNISHGKSSRSVIINKINLYSMAVSLILTVATLTFFEFSFLSQLYLIVFTYICTYQITKIAGRIGIAHLGRFATFVMVPGMFMFNWSFLQITLTACFVEICGGVATDILFGRKLAKLAGIPNSYIKKYQLFGLVVSCAAVGLIFWLLITHFSLGSADLFAQKAKARALLVNANRFNNYILACGCLFSYVLKKLNINMTLVLGGLLMPINISFGLVFGALIAHFTKSREEWFPFWSGVFASHSIWMLLKTLF
jgi:hypothetical protein